MKPHNTRARIIWLLSVLAMLPMATAQAAPWLNLSPVYYRGSGYLEWRYNTTASEVTDGAGNRSLVSSHSNSLHSAYNVGLNQHIRGYISKPWIAQFTVATNLDNSINNFHNIQEGSFTSRGSITASTHLFPYNPYDSILTINYIPTLYLQNNSDSQFTEFSSLQFTQNYEASKHDGTYVGRYNLTEGQDSLALSGKQFFGNTALSQRYSLQRTGVDGEANTNNVSSAYLTHSYRPEFSGVVVSNMVSTVDIAPATGRYTGPLPVTINTNLSYMYDAEYVDLKTVPSISGGTNVVLDRAGILEPQFAANVRVGWPTWRQLQMGTQLTYSAFGDSTTTTLAHNARRGFSGKRVGAIQYNRHLQGGLQNRWTDDDSLLSWNLGAGHSLNSQLKYQALQPISVGINQNINLSGNTYEALQGGSLSHSAYASTTFNDISFSSNLSDTRSFQFATNSVTATQNAQASMAKPIFSDSYVNSDAKFNVQWQQTQREGVDTSSQWASLQYSYSNRRIAKQRNLSGNYTVIGKLDDSGSSLTASGGINYYIGSVQVGGKSSVTLLNDKSFSASLNVKRLF